MAMRSHTVLAQFGAVVVAVVLLSSCAALGLKPKSGQSSTSAASQPAPSSTVPRSSSSPDATSEPTAGRNDLKSKRLDRTFRAGSIRITVAYTTSQTFDRWKTGVPEPLSITMTARGSGGQKIYLSRVTIYMDISDDTGPLGGPDPIIDSADTAGISPGFLVTTPNTYNQVFVLPPLPDGARTLVLSLRYEILLLQGSRDYVKRAATDTIVMTR
jgi:hypothetical protein